MPFGKKALTGCQAKGRKVVKKAEKAESYYNKNVKFFKVEQSTVPFNSVWQSHVTGPSKLPKCHVGHGNFYKVPKSFCDLALKYRNFLPPAAQNCGKSPNVTVSLGGCQNQNFVDASCVTWGAELN